MISDQQKSILYSLNMTTAIILFLGLSFGYISYLHTPQHFTIGECFTEIETNEIYKTITKNERDLSFKDHWIFGPMKFEAVLIRPNPNTLRKLGIRRLFYPSTENLKSTQCD